MRPAAFVCLAMLAPGCDEPRARHTLADLPEFEACMVLDACRPTSPTWGGASSCAAAAWMQRLSGPVPYDSLLEGWLRRCLPGRPACGTEDACLGDPVALQAACDAAGIAEGSLCLDGDLVLCGGDEAGAYRLDCLALGMDCVSTPEFAACLGPLCDSADAAPRCEGGEYVACLGLFEVRLACPADDGLACYPMEGCLGAGPPCRDTYYPRCEGTAVVTCEGRREARFDCALLGGNLACEEGGPSSRPCVPVEASCLPLDERCDDGVIAFCPFGAPLEFDCRQHGLSGCEEREVEVEGLGDETRTVARCTP